MITLTIFILIFIVCVEFLVLKYAGVRIKPISRKQRIIETIDRGNNKNYIIQQKNIFGWFKAYEIILNYYGNYNKYLIFVSHKQAENKLKELIKEKTESNLKKYNKKIITTKIVSITKKTKL